MNSSTWRKLTIIVLVHMVFVGIWWGAVILGDIPTYILPTPWESLQTLKVENFNWMMHFVATAQEIFGGYI